jgi:biopolymer transport protein ExbB/TolQ
MLDLRPLAASASLRAAATLHLDLKRGIDSLATVAATGSLLGLYLGAMEVVHAFQGGTGSKSAHFARLFANLTEVWLPIAYGLGLSLFAHAAHRTLLAELDNLRREAEIAAIEYSYRFHNAELANSPLYHP